MKTHLLTATLALASSLSLTAQTVAPWTTVDVYNYSNSSRATAVCTDPNGAVYVAAAGQTNINGNYLDLGTIRSSFDGGATWNLEEAYSYHGNDTRFNGIAANASGNVFAAGQSMIRGESDSYHWIVRKRDSLGNWTLVDDFIPPDAPHARARAITVDAAGNIYVVGNAKKKVVTGKTSYVLPQYWFLRKSSDGGATWTTVNTYALEVTQNGFPNAVTTSPQGLFVAGRFYSTARGASGWRWIIRYSPDFGTTWQTIDNYLQTVGSITEPFGIAADDFGNVYAAGNSSYMVNKQSSSFDWIVRKGTVTGNFITVDRFRAGTGETASANSVATLVGGIVIAGGRAVANGTNNWVTRFSRDGVNWETADTFRLSAGESSNNFGIAGDGFSNVYAVGGGKAGGKSHSVVRKTQLVP
jgi:hypothetical protein